jgi:hypothetical protein
MPRRAFGGTVECGDPDRDADEREGAGQRLDRRQARQRTPHRQETAAGQQRDMRANSEK